MRPSASILPLTWLSNIEAPPLARDQAKIESHVAQWKHNRLLIAAIPRTHPDWVVTVAFYTAVHAIDAVLAFEGINVHNHETRFRAIAGIPRLKKIGILYLPLYDLCRKVRYTANPGLWILPERIDKDVIRARLLPLEKSAEGLMGKDLQLPSLDLAHLTATVSPATAASTSPER